MNKLGSAKAFSTNSRKILLMIVRNPGLNQQKDTFSAPSVNRTFITNLKWWPPDLQNRQQYTASLSFCLHTVDTDDNEGWIKNPCSRKAPSSLKKIPSRNVRELHSKLSRHRRCTYIWWIIWKFHNNYLDNPWQGTFERLSEYICAAAHSDLAFCITLIYIYWCAPSPGSGWPPESFHV